MTDIFKAVVVNLLTKPMKVLVLLGWKLFIFGVPLLLLAIYLGDITNSF
jgi:hypothetical protein